MESGEFPRGGKPLLTPLEVRNTRLQAERDVLFGEKESRKSGIPVSDQIVGNQEAGGKKRRRSKKIADALDQESVPAKKVKKSVDTLTFKKLQTGSLLLGAVKEVSDYDATVSLPSGLSGFIHTSNISTVLCDKIQEATEKEEDDEKIGEDNDELEDDIPKLSDVLHVGNLVRCYVQNLNSSPTSHHRIQLSTDPDLVNSKLKSSFVRPGLVLPGCVTSVEEHGYLISFGIKGRNGFLLNKQARKYIKDSNDGKPLFVGQVIDCLVLPFAPSELKTVPVTVSVDEVNKSLVNEDMMLNMSMLIPGMLVNATVTDVLSDGLILSFLGGFTGTVSINHLSGDHITTEQYKCLQKVKGRIIFVDPATKSVGVSLRKSVVENRAETFEGLSVGDIVETAKVLRVSSELGLVMQLDEKHRGFVHISRVSDKHIEKLQGKKYKVMSAHRCRILGFNTLEGMATLSMQKSVLERAFLRYADIEIGSVISGVVHSVELFGIVVTVTDHIRGLCPLMHLADVRLKHPERKFKEKKKMKFRVLEVDPLRHKLILSHKKTLLQSKSPALCRKADAVIGGTYHGTVVSIRHYGCIVAFYGDVKGLLHKTELGPYIVEDPSKFFYLGQVVQCRVISTDYGKLRLSLKTGDTESSSLSKVATGSQVHIKPGTICEASLGGVSSEGLDVIIHPEEIPAFIPAYHLSDHCDHWRPLLAAYSARLEGSKREQQIIRAIVVGRDKGGILLLSMKPILMTSQAIRHAQSLEFSELKTGFVMAGVIKQIMPFGCFISFVGGLLGLAPIRNLTDKYLNSPTDAFKVGQSVFAKVTEIDSTKRRFLVSLCRSDVENTKQDASLSGLLHFNSYLSERHMIEQARLSQNKDSAQLFANVSCGSVVKGKVLSKTMFGLYLRLDVSSVKAFVPPGHFNDDSVVGQGVIGVVLDRDCQKSVVDVSLKQDLVTCFNQTTKQKKHQHISSTSDTSHQVLSRGTLVDVCVQLIKPDYLILSLLDSSPMLAVAPTKAHVNDIASLLPASKRYAVGDTMKATVERAPDVTLDLQGITSLPVVSLLPGMVSVPRGPADDMKIGTVVTAKITSVKELQLNVDIKVGCQGRIHITEMQDNIQPGDEPFNGYHSGQEVQAVVVGFRDSKSHKYLPISHRNFKHTIVELSLRQSRLSLSDAKTKDQSEVLSIKKYLKQVKEGDSVTGFVQEVDKHALTVVLTPTVRGSVAAIHLSTDISVVRKMRKHFCPGQCLTLTVLETAVSKAFVELSLIGSLEEVRRLSEVGSVGVGRVVKQVVSQGLHIQLPGRKLGLVALTDISDDYRKISLSDFHENTIVKYVVLEISGNGHIDLSLRPSRVLSAESVDKSEIPDVTNREIKSMKDISEGDVVRGFVVSVAQRAGVFIRLARKLTARAKIAMLFDGYFKNWDKHFQIGQVIRTKVLSLDEETGQIDVSLRLSDVDPAAAAKHRKKRSLKRKRRDSESERSSSKKKSKISSGEDSGNETGDEMDVTMKMKKSSAGSSSEEESENEGDWSSEETEVVKVGRIPTDDSDKPRLKLSRKFDWSEQPAVATAPESQAAESSDEEQEEAHEPSRKKTKRQKRAEKKQDEAEVYQTERSLLEQGVIPETPDDFDRLLLSTPNSSVLWLQYMAYYLHLTEIDKARGVAERALKTISFREEKEKLNIWTALMNLENLYGTEESLLKVFEAALQQNEPVVVFFKLVNIYIQSKKFEHAEQLYNQMTKRFSLNKDVWIKFGIFRMKQGQVEASRKLLQRSLKVLPKKDHIDVIVKFAQLEFKFGEPERGRTVFESVLSNYPKRVDLWSIYIDMMIRLEDPQPVRDIFERVICLNLSTKKMKFFFKRYLEFEQKYGDSTKTAAVEQKARDYVELKISKT